jgi:hypothetical protein
LLNFFPCTIRLLNSHPDMVHTASGGQMHQHSPLLPTLLLAFALITTLLWLLDVRPVQGAGILISDAAHPHLLNLIITGNQFLFGGLGAGLHAAAGSPLHGENIYCKCPHCSTL